LDSECNSDYDCMTGLYCDGLTGASFCTTKLNDGASCYTGHQCISGYCLDDTCGGNCSPNCGYGQTCTFDTDCSTSLYCGLFGTCEFQLSNGATCSRDAMCVNDNCIQNVCGSCTSNCGLNEPCSSDSTCNSGMWCSVGFCAYKYYGGTFCTSDNQCYSGDCSGSNGWMTCTGSSTHGNAGIGQSCSSSYDCKVNLYCSNSVCAQQVSRGSSCQAYDACASGSWCQDYSYLEAGTCVATYPNGHNCTDAVQCDSDYCSSSNRCDKNPLVDLLTKGAEIVLGIIIVIIVAIILACVGIGCCIWQCCIKKPENQTVYMQV